MGCIVNMVYITIEELERSRKSSEVRGWVENKIREVGTSDDGKHAIRFRQGLVKELIEEALPLGIFCDLYFGGSEKVIVEHTIGNQNYDIKINDNREDKSEIEFIEITQAHEGENEHLRMLKLEEEGHVNPLGRMKAYRYYNRSQ
jgi:hypothetical protein